MKIIRFWKCKFCFLGKRRICTKPWRFVLMVTYSMSNIYYLKSTDSLTARFYGQPKIQKLEVPIGPIVSYSGAPLYSLNKYIANILKAYTKDENNSGKNSTTFCNYIRSISNEDDVKMVSSDVTSLYTNSRTTDTLNKDYGNNDDQFTRKTPIPQDKFLDLVNLVLTTTCYFLNFTNKVMVLQ